MTDRELFKITLDALDLCGRDYMTVKEIENFEALEIALRARIEQPERNWVGLTDDEMFAALVQVDPLTKRLAPGFEHYARAIESKLKEKNCG